MDGTEFICEIKNSPEMIPRDNLFNTLWEEYERVVLHSLLTSFGLDFIVKDQHGGDVDTIHTVREIGYDQQMTYKSRQNELDYASHGEYNYTKYHSDKQFSQIKANSRKAFDTDGTLIKDAYVPGNTLIPRNNKTIQRNHQGQLDHVISAHEIHDDRGRILSGIDGLVLANNPKNLRYTNADFNLSKSDMPIEELIKKSEGNPSIVNQGGRRGKSLSKAVKQRLRSTDKKARLQYDTLIAQKYYTSPEFAKNVSYAAKNRATEMGIRQALGVVFIEIWMCTKAELMAVPPESDIVDMLNAVGNGIKKGAESAKNKYREIIEKLGEGFTAGALASLTTTLCNMFFTTAKNIVRYIRQVYASVVQAGKVLFLNPDNLMVGDRIRSTSVILASGASVLAGTVTGDLVSHTPIGAAPEIGTTVTTFCSTMISGLLSCTFLTFLDRSKFINELITLLNKIPSIETDYREAAIAMESLAAKIANLDIDKFRQDTEKYANVASKIFDSTEDDINSILYDAYEQLGIKIPWDGDFDTFMGNRNNRLMFD